MARKETGGIPVRSAGNCRLRQVGPMTTEGSTGKATRAKIAEHVDITRRRLVDGVAREEYLATIEVLQRMTANLEGDPAG